MAENGGYKSVATAVQRRFKELLEADGELARGGCEVYCENSMTLLKDIAAAQILKRGVAVVVTTPDIENAGQAEARAYDMTVAIHCRELPAMRATRPAESMTALDAALRVAEVVQDGITGWADIRQRADRSSGIVTATVTCRITAT